ncbi:MAG: iron ABC transporter permease, partial [Spirochaetes bacterium]|nr:iron ABC transporter permease [Spirochaetota bacterium]MBU0956894.1 iron ABC transporter permease [Spirochaetota bacterium]
LMPPASLLDDPMAQNIILLIRLPRVLGAILAGAALGAAGCAFQLIFANPLVDAGFLGVSQGASFGAALAMSLGGGLLAIFGLAFGFGLLALGLAIFLASRIQFGGAVLRLVLSGIAISAFFSAAVSLIKYLADPIRQLPDISYWLMGGLSGMSWELLAIAAGPALFSVSVLLLLRWRILLLSLDEGTAASLGARPRAERLLIMGAASLGAASVSAAAGPISWVGLIVPHVSRLLLGSDGSASLPASALTGAIFVLLCDTLARALFAGELPLGIVSALLGTAVFFALLAGRRLRVERT